MNDDQLLWQSQSAEPARIAPDELRKRMEALERRTRVRTRGGYVACGGVILGALWWLTLFDNVLQRTGALLTIAGIGVLLYQIRVNQLATRAAAEVGSTASLQFHRAELARQRDFHRGSRFWTRMLALIPGPWLFLYGFYQAYPHLATILAIEAITFVVLFLAAIPLNLRIARNYQRQLDQLQKEQS